MLLTLIHRCFNSVTNKFFYAILGMTLLITIAIFTGFLITTYTILSHYTEDTFWLFAAIINFFGTGTAFSISHFLFPMTFPLISALFAEKIFAHIEKKHYRISVDTKINSHSAYITSALKFMIKALFLNIIALVLYLIPVIGLILYYYINAYLFGKEYFDMTAHRYSEIKTTKSDYKANRFSILSTGFLICIMFTFPIINFLAPVLAIIIMAHLYHTKISKLEYHQ